MRPLTGEDYAEIWNRRKWLFLGTWSFIAAATCLVVALIPPLYESSSLIILENRQALNSGPGEPLVPQLDSLVQQALSRTHLEQLVREMQGVEPGAPVADSLIDAMQKQISVNVLTVNSGTAAKGPPYALTVSFSNPSPKVAQYGANEVASYFVELKLRTDERTAQDTERLLRAQLDAATSDLQQKQQKLTEFEQRYRGQLPVDEGLILQTLSRLQAQLQTTEQNLERLRQREGSYTDTSSQTAAAAQAGKSGPDPLAELQKRLLSLETLLSDLQSRYTPNHPDVIKIKQQVLEVKAEIAREQGKLVAQASPNKPVQSNNATSPENARKQQDTQAEIATLGEQEKRLGEQIASWETNLRAIPLHEQEYSELRRDHDNAKQDYDRVLKTFQQSQVDNNVAMGLQGARFRIQDFASLPQNPSWPLRWKVNLGGVAAGLLIGLVLIGGLELGNSSMKSDRDVEYYLETKNLATVPVLYTPAELTRIHRKKWFGIASSTTFALAMSGTLIYLYFLR